MLVLLSPDRESLRGLGLSFGTALLAGLAAAPLGALGDVGNEPGRARDGAIMLAVLAVLCAVAALLSVRAARADSGGARPLPLRAAG